MRAIAYVESRGLLKLSQRMSAMVAGEIRRFVLFAARRAPFFPAAAAAAANCDTEITRLLRRRCSTCVSLIT